MTLETPQWFALWTNSHCEQLVHDSLAARGLRSFLPLMGEWSRRAGVSRLITRPMFPGYLFVHEVMDKRTYIEVVKTRGLVRVLGERWDKLAPIDDKEIDAIRTLVTADIPVQPYPYLQEGQRVRITDGALAGTEGYFVRSRPNRGLLVISIALLQRSVAVEIPSSAVEPMETASAPVFSAAPVPALAGVR